VLEEDPATRSMRSSTRVLFLCWGFSIHARRRIQIFVDDPAFQVAVVSTFDYAFPNAMNVKLSGASINPSSSSAGAPRRFLRSWLSPALKEKLVPIRTLLGLGSEVLSAWRDFMTLRETVDGFRPDVVFLQTLQYPSYLAYGLSGSTPTVITFWNGDVTYYAKWTGLEMLAKRRLVLHGITRATAITVNSKTAFEKCLEHGATADKLHLIRYPGADLTRFKPGSREGAGQKIAVSAQKVVLCPRGLGSFFNSDVIVEAAAHVIRQVPSVLFLFISGVGGQAEWERHVARGQELGFANNLRWDGQVAWEDMPAYYQCADTMVSIKTNDSMPNCMIEAMACGVPVIMSNTPQNREWVVDGTNGFLCQPRDPVECAAKILRVLQDDGNLAKQFASINLSRVASEANSAVNSERIKQLVKDLVPDKESARSKQHSITC
jgi:glycosyltransferase involved in cell wall biosynthesis